jgi:hypothetical protein
MIFVSENRTRNNNKLTIKELAQEWKGLERRDKEEYETKAKVAKDKYSQLYEQWNLNQK